MHTDVRSWLYLLGFIPSFFFTLRFILQWLKSETKKQSYVFPSFWIISLIGNVLLMVHGIIQLQYHVSVVQGFNGVISWRNLQLMKKKEEANSLSFVILLHICVFFIVTLIFILQNFYLHETYWFRVPITPWQSISKTVSFSWHILGIIGIALYSSRFWVQWWIAEKKQQSSLEASFWLMSLLGGIISLIYFLAIGDLANALGPAFGLVPYTRNLFLIKKANAKQI